MDTVRCPVTGAFTDCDGLFKAVTGGNPNLKPETSEQFNAGLVWEPVAGLSLTVDYWKINKANVISTLDATTIFSNLAFYGPTNIVRGPVDPAYPNLPGPIQTVLLLNQNLGDLRTSGIDVDVEWHSQATSIGRFSFGSNGTYLIDWNLVQPEGLNYVSGVGQNCADCFGPLPRWKNYATLDWRYSSWGATLAQTYQSGYEDANRFRPPLATTPPRQVSSYEVWDLQGRFTGFKKYDRCARHQEPDGSRAAIHQSAILGAGWLRSGVRRSAWTRLLRAADVQFQVERRVKPTNGCNHTCKIIASQGRSVRIK